MGFVTKQLSLSYVFLQLFNSSLTSNALLHRFSIYRAFQIELYKFESLFQFFRDNCYKCHNVAKYTEFYLG
jgi:hypothetical protein